MTAVLAEQGVVLPLLDEETSLAAVNAPEQCVASGLPGIDRGPGATARCQRHPLPSPADRSSRSTRR